MYLRYPPTPPAYRPPPLAKGGNDYLYMDIKQTLKNYGLNEEEISLYLAALKIGEAPLADIAYEAGIKRSSAYSFAKSLELKGLMGSFKMRSGLRFIASPPSRLKNQLERRLDEVNQILPELSALSGNLQTKPKITFFEGKESYFTILEESLLQTGGVIRHLGSLKNIYEIVTKEYDSAHYIPTRVKNRIGFKALYYEQVSDVALKSDYNELREIRFLPQKFFIPTSTLIYRNTVAVFTSKEELICLKIESEEIAQSEKKKFDLLWELIGS